MVVDILCRASTQGGAESMMNTATTLKLYNLGEDIQYFQRGDKIAQLVILPIVTPTPKLVDKFAKTERVDNGFGSTGR